jgi:hypothetical protein
VAEKLSSNRSSTKVSPSPIEDEDEGCGSPRTNVAHQFQGLEIQAGSISKLDLQSSFGNDGAPAEGNATRKRQKIFDLEEEIEIPETPEVGRATFNPDPVGEPVGLGFMNSFQIDNALKPVAFKGLSAHSKSSAARLQRAYPSINRLADSKSRARKRVGTPPRPPSNITDATLVDIEDTIVDPDRAALTWHDDEITGHDPSDPEDDGEGINGIGFKPTPAEARARAERRRQQMADYKSREMKEARAKRSERRREGTNLATESKAEAARRVRFSESEANVMITTI